MYLFPMMQTLHVIFQDGLAFCGAGGGVAGCVYNVAGENFLPEGKAAGGTWSMSVIVRVTFGGPIIAGLGWYGELCRRTAVQAVAGCHCEL
jgi:hypothetical protein